MLRLLAAAVLLSTVSAFPPGNFSTSMDTILKAIGTMPCMRKCIDPLIGNFSAVWEMKDIKSHTEKICKAYEEASKCLVDDLYCDLPKNFAKAAKGLEQRCLKQVKLFEGQAACVNPHLDRITEKCDKKCNGRKSLLSFANKTEIQGLSKIGGNAIIAVAHVREMCTSLGCLLPCMTEELNAVCTDAGWLALDSLLQPLEAISSGIDGMGQHLKKFILDSMDDKCKFIVDSSLQTRIRKGDLKTFK